jgi:hypothetical protein
VLGSLSDFNHAIGLYTDAVQAGALVWLSLHLAETPCKPIDFKSPNDVLRQSFADAVD